MTKRNCYLCNIEAEYSFIPDYKDERSAELYVCPSCGNYLIPNSHILEGRNDEKYYVSCYLFETKEKRGESPIFLSTEEIKRILDEKPVTIAEKVCKILEFISKNTTFFGEDVKLDKRIIYAKRIDEIENLAEALENYGLIEKRSFIGSGTIASISIKGIEYLEETKKKTALDKCFIAMCFDEELNEIYDKCFIPACIEAGYEPVRVDREQYNGDITDKIISSIRTTRFTIADSSKNRSGVYYEAGFAKGLGKEVILTCDEEWFNGKPEENKKIHFDVNHLNIIIWSRNKLAKLKEDLTNRILATIGEGSYIAKDL